MSQFFRIIFQLCVLLRIFLVNDDCFEFILGILIQIGFIKPSLAGIRGLISQTFIVAGLCRSIEAYLYLINRVKYSYEEKVIIYLIVLLILIHKKFINNIQLRFIIEYK